MTRPISISYPHFRPSYEPRPVPALVIGQIAEAVRQQIVGESRRPKIDVARVIARARHMTVNGVSFETHWEFGGTVADDMGNPVMGAIEHSDARPEAATIHLNGEVIGDREDLVRSTALHELGHAVFDTPSWIQRARQCQLRFGAADPMPERRFQSVTRAAEPSAGNSGIDWREWRANEFMGTFLAPRRLLHLHMHKRAAALGIPMVDPPDDMTLPIVHQDRAGFDAIEALGVELAEIFGVSVPFIMLRLHKYRLLAS